jgi:hypothetical protein
MKGSIFGDSSLDIHKAYEYSILTDYNKELFDRDSSRTFSEFGKLHNYPINPQICPENELKGNKETQWDRSSENL